MAFNTYIGDVIAILQLGEKIWRLGWSKELQVGAYRPHPVQPRAFVHAVPAEDVGCLSYRSRKCVGKRVKFESLTFGAPRTSV
jgi:hypothetical protein